MGVGEPFAGYLSVSLPWRPNTSVHLPLVGEKPHSYVHMYVRVSLGNFQLLYILTVEIVFSILALATRRIHSLP